MMTANELREEAAGELPLLLERFLEVRRQTENLCLPLTDEDACISVTSDTSPPKWHLAHTTWFFEKFILERFKRDRVPYRNEYHFLFNSYYKRLGNFLPKEHRGHLSRPSLSEILIYRQAITNEMIDFLHSPVFEDKSRLSELLELGINHEEQHQELLLMDIKRNFFDNPVRPKYGDGDPFLRGELRDSEFRIMKAGAVTVGKKREETGFAFDNERDQHKQWLEPFELCSHLVTNDEYAAFIDEGGYDNPLLWLSDGWDMKEKEGWEHPLYWERSGKDWWTMSLSGMVPLDLSAPVVHISYYEAQAFAKWKGCRLPTEFEWEACARLEHSRGEFMEEGSFEPLGAETDGEIFTQIHGTVWEWTQSAYLPYPRYEALKHGLSEYNGKFMCNQFVLRGGSCVTPEKHYRATYRNFYYPHMRWQYAGLRLAKDVYGKH